MHLLKRHTPACAINHDAVNTEKLGNVLVIGNSGVGKSTLINAVLGEEKARTGWGIQGTTDRLEIYTSNEIPFRIIDTIGFEPSLAKERRAIEAVRKWSKACAKKGREDNQINVIWFCVDGTSSKLFPKAIKALSRATSMWKSVPVVVVITKSYSVPERARNVEMVYRAFASQRKHTKNLKKVLPVVSSTYTINDNAYAPPEGISELIEVTNELLPEGIRAGAHDLAAFQLSRKRTLAHGIVAASTTAGTVIGAVPVPVADALILSPLEMAEISAIAQVYGINKNEKATTLFTSIVEMGTVSTAARASISSLKAIPGINLATSAMNAVIAGSIVAALGEGSIYIFEQIYLGNKTVDDLDWVSKIMESKFSAKFVEKATEVATLVAAGKGKVEIAKAIAAVFKQK